MMALFPKVPKIQRPKALKIHVFDYSTRLTPPLKETTVNITRNKSYWATSSPPQCGSIFIQIFLVASERRMFCAIECVIAVQGHPRSLILLPIDSAYATSYQSSIVTLSLVLYCPVTETLQVFYREQRPRTYSTRIMGCSLWSRLPMLGLQGAKTLS